MASVLTFVGVQLVIVLFAISPLAISVAAGQLGSALGCRVDESAVHPCMLGSIDIGKQLYSAGVFGWLVLATLPAGAVLWVAHILYTLVRVIRSRRQRMPPGA